jgi:hypothetical protein
MRIFSFLFFIALSSKALAQFSFSTGDHVLEVSGMLSSYYNYRELKQGEVDKQKNRFNLRDASFTLEGRVKKVFGYQLQMDFADMAQNAAGNVDDENPGLMDAFVYANVFSKVRVKVGYMKVPYSFGSLTPFYQSPYWQRAEFLRGNFFGRRDVGALIQTDFFNRKLEVWTGVFNGLGEKSLNGDNDASGGLEFAGRISFSYPARYRFQFIDKRVSRIPFFSLGINHRYSLRNMPAGENLIPGSAGEYGIKVLDGKKYLSGVDFSFHYLGFSLQAEIHQLLGRPNDTTSFLLGGTSLKDNEGFFRSGCEIVQLNYFWKRARTGFSVRYENMNVNDLFAGSTSRLTYALFYAIKGTESMIKANYTSILSEDAIDPLKYTAQFRIGWQWMF